MVEHEEQIAASRRTVLVTGALSAAAGALGIGALRSAGVAEAAVPADSPSAWSTDGTNVFYGDVPPYSSPTATFAESFERGLLGQLPNSATTDYDNTIGDNGDVGANVQAAFAAGGVSGQCVRFWNPTVAPNTFGFLGKNVAATRSCYVRRYVKIDAAPTYRTSFLLAKYGGIYGPHHGSVAVGGTAQGHRFVLVDVDTNSTQSTTPVPIGQWFRIEWHPDLAAGTQTLRVFLGANLHGTSPDEQISAPIYTGSPIDYLEDGILTNPGVAVNVWIDEAVNDSAVWPGPIQFGGGNVGIGTDAPQYKLDVTGTASVAGDLLVSGAVRVGGAPLAPALPTGYGPPSGGYLMPNSLTAVASTGLTSGRVSFVPVDVGPAGLAVAALVVNCSSAQVGGSTTVALGLYADDGSGGQPRCAGGPLVGGSVAVTASGVRPVPVSIVLAPGRYWAACGYFVASAPTAPAQLSGISASSATITLWNRTFPSIVRYLALTGQTGLPTVAAASFTTGTDGGGIVVGVQAR